MNTLPTLRFAACLTGALMMLASQPTEAAAETAKSVAPKLARPTPVQYAWHEQERIQFVCLSTTGSGPLKTRRNGRASLN